MSSPDEMKTVNALRFLSIDMIEKAKSGHPGLPIDAAPMAYVLWEKMMNFNPKDPKWLNRDRFVLSAGHGSALLYSLLHFNKFSVSMDDIKQFRQLGSMTPGIITVVPIAIIPNIDKVPTIKLTKNPSKTAFGAYGKIIGTSRAGLELGTSF